MSGQIRKEDIIEQKEIEAAFAAVAKSMQPFINNIKEATTVSKQLNEILKSENGFKNLIKDSKKVDENTKTLSNSQKQLNGIFKEFIKDLTKQSDGVKQLKKYYSELEKESNKVAAAEKRKNAEMQKTRSALDTQRSKAYTQELKKQEQETKLLINAEKAAAGSKQKLVAENKLLEFRMRNLNTLIPEQRAQYEKLRTEVNANNQKMADMGQKTGGLRGMFNNLIKSIGLYAAAIFGLNRLVQFFTRDLLNMTKTLDSLDFSMKTVIKSQEEVAQTQLFLSKTAQNYGQDILTLTERYIKFRAAAQQSNMSARETQKIFDSTAKAAAVLGLKTDEVNGVFLALEQMISKGKVTTEELRRQLGERLPGAMGIMADALGVTIVELDKMLKAGSVLSSEALPKFAVALEKAYGIESVTKVKTLAAAQGRLRTSWVEFVDALNASNAYTKTIDFLTKKFTSLQYSMSIPKGLKKDTENYFNMLEDGYTRFGSILRRAGIGVSPFAKLFERDARRFKELMEEMSDAEKKGNAKSKEYFMERLNDIGFSLDKAESLWTEYYRRIKGITEKESDNLLTFDLEGYKDSLDKAQTATELYAILSNEELKKYIKTGNEYMKWGKTSYEEILTSQIETLKKKRENAQIESDKLEKIAEDSAKRMAEFAKGNITSSFEPIGLNAEQQKQREAAGVSVVNITEAIIEAEKRLYDLRNKETGKTGTTKDDSLAIAKKSNELKIAILEYSLNKQAEIDGESKAKELERETLLIQTKKMLNDDLLQYVKKGSKEYYDIWATSYELQTQLAQKRANILKQIDDDFIKNNEETFKRWGKEAKERDEQRIADLYALINDQRVIMSEAATEQLKNAKNDADRKQIIEKKLGLAQAQFTRERLEELLKEGLETIELNEWVSDEIKRLKEEENNFIRDQNKLTRDEQIRNLLYLGQAVSNGANFYNQLLEGQLNRAKQLYEADAAAAGDSAEKKYLAEQKYLEEQRKLKRRQAIADRAQALFNIGLELAMAEAKLNPFQIAAAILAAATVIATPIPQFAAGTKDAPETFIAGEKGSEAIIKPSGEVVVTPNKPTMFSDKSFIGSTILPHDETQRMLANYAISQSYDMIDMSDTNNLLNRIAKNTSGSGVEYFDKNGVLYRKNGYVTSKVRR